MQSAGESLQKWAASSGGSPSLMVAQAAIEPYFGVHNDAAVKGAIGSAISMIPVVGGAWDIAQGIAGKEFLTGARMSPGQQALSIGSGVVGLLPVVADAVVGLSLRPEATYLGTVVSEPKVGGLSPLRLNPDVAPRAAAFASATQRVESAGKAMEMMDPSKVLVASSVAKAMEK